RGKVQTSADFSSLDASKDAKIYCRRACGFDSRAAMDRTLAAAVFKTTPLHHGAAREADRRAASVLGKAEDNATPLHHGAAREAMVGASAGLFIFRSLKAYNKTTFKKGEGIWNNVKTSFGARRHK
ncbi:MAG: hypothetical protein IJF45_00630, partial [Clostridia bacterium]|nr:hypothetical protein [Clostridia bacterium]